MVYRIFVEKKRGHDAEAQGLCDDLRYSLRLDALRDVRVLNRYDVEGISREVFDASRNTIFSEPMVDTTYDDSPDMDGYRIFAVEYLPGQYDQRADSCSQCIQLLTTGERPTVRSAKVYYLSGELSDMDFERIKGYIINPVEAREASLSLPETLKEDYGVPSEVKILDGFTELDEDGLRSFLSEYSLAMDYDDVVFCQSHFRDEEGRDPTITELRLIDSYWSDHCRHTTFLTTIDDVSIADSYIKDTFQLYLSCRETVYSDRKKPVTLMDIATMGAKYLKKQGILQNLDESEEINACSIKVKANINGVNEDWLVMFKNETHNHPTEIEPFGGAATCLGGAIRDPLSGRSYVYQAMRVTGAADPRTPVSETLHGKLPQAKITLGAASGYSSYGNQIGLATGHVSELYHPGYVAKRMEIGAVIGAAPAANVVRSVPQPGDVVILLGGKTGRDGCGGATGSSKSHTVESIATCGAEVQKGNAPEERKIQRLFRDGRVTRLIKRCNDFGAGGVSVAIGELADGLLIDLSRVPKKYEGLDGTELAISESQERMAVVVAKEDAAAFCGYAVAENLEATIVAVVTDNSRLTMLWNENTLVDLSRDFLNSNGAVKHTSVEVSGANVLGVSAGPNIDLGEGGMREAFTALLSDLNVCSQKGLAERFDSTIGAGSVTMPFGGALQLTPQQYMAALLPVENGTTDTCSVMAYGFNPYLSGRSPYHGAVYAVVESVARLVAAGVDYKSAYLTLQEYFPRTKDDPQRWGLPFAALLGAFRAQYELGIAAIGGKDSMSGTFEDIDVPPTLVSFALGMSDAHSTVTQEFKRSGSGIYLLKPLYDKNGLPDFGDLKKLFGYVKHLAESGAVYSCWAVGYGGVAEAVSKMGFGNQIGTRFSRPFGREELFGWSYGAFIIESPSQIQGERIGITTSEPFVSINGQNIALDELTASWEGTLERVFPTKPSRQEQHTARQYTYPHRSDAYSSQRFIRPRVVVPVFPGTNCEYDVRKAFVSAGAEVSTAVLRNLSPVLLEDSIKMLADMIDSSQIIALPGGFSGGDEPDGSGKFITAVLRSPRVREAVTLLLSERDGLMLGICNGFQALVKTGLLPYGEIRSEMMEDDATLTFNSIARHQSGMVRTRVASVKSPWMNLSQVGDINSIPVSHGEGRFTAPAALIKQLGDNGQIATQYVDLSGGVTMDPRFNPNGSDMAIEGIFSPDGRVFGKMAHTERTGENVLKNVPGRGDIQIFRAGVEYFK